MYMVDIPESLILKYIVELGSISKWQHLHPEEGDTGEEVHRRFKVLESLGTAGREIVLQ